MLDRIMAKPANLTTPEEALDFARDIVLLSGMILTNDPNTTKAELTIFGRAAELLRAKRYTILNGPKPPTNGAAA